MENINIGRRIGITSVAIFAVVATGCVGQQGDQHDVLTEWHDEPKKQELWGLKELPYEVYKTARVGDSIETIDKTFRDRKVSVVCYVSWKGRASYQVCFKLLNNKVIEKSIRKVSLVY